MIRAIAATVLALGFAGTALADRHDGRWDRHDNGRYDRRHDQRHDRHDRRDNRHYDRRDHRGRAHAAPHYQYRWRAPRPRGWYPGWREPYGRGYRYWNDNYYYVVPGPPSINLGFSIPLR